MRDLCTLLHGNKFLDAPFCVIGSLDYADGISLCAHELGGADGAKELDRVRLVWSAF